jgi:LysM repeat protein
MPLLTDRSVRFALLPLAVAAIPMLLPAAAHAHVYTVRPGDSLWAIGARNWVSAEAVASASGREVDAPLPIGARVRIPAAPVGARAATGYAFRPTGPAQLRPDAAAAWERLVAAARERMGVELYAAGPLSGGRTRAQQAELWRLYQAGLGAPAAPPGTSSHELGTALDVASPEMRRVVDLIGAEFGWQKVERPDEWWHVSYVG